MTKSAPAKRPAKNKVTKSRTVAGFMFLFSFHSHLYRTMRYIVIRSINDISLIVKGAKGSQPHIIKTNELQILASHQRVAVCFLDIPEFFLVVSSDSTFPTAPPRTGRAAFTASGSPVLQCLFTTS